MLDRLGACFPHRALPLAYSTSKKLQLSTALRQSGFGAPANLADWPRQGSNPGPTGFEAKRLSRPVHSSHTAGMCIHDCAAGSLILSQQ